MQIARLEHANITVTDAKATAAWLCEVFDWHIRWQGEAIHGGYTVHVGTDDGYLAVFAPLQVTAEADSTYEQKGGLNHVGLVVEDLDAVESKVNAVGFRAHKHADYEPGKRFYFNDADGIEFEVVSYTKAA